MDPNSFGYPTNCTKCGAEGNVKVKPFFQYRDTEYRLMIIGQDPTINSDPDRVKTVLMLDNPNSQLSRWLTEVFTTKVMKSSTIYATNLVKCSFATPPGRTKRGGRKFLEPFFKNCKQHLLNEIQPYRRNA